MIQQLVEKSNGLFAWASAAADRIDNFAEHAQEWDFAAALQAVDDRLLDDFYKAALDDMGD